MHCLDPIPQALLGALFVDGGYAAAERFFEAKVAPLMEIDEPDLNVSRIADQKRLLQEHLVASGLQATALGTQLKYVPVAVEQRDGAQSYTQAIYLFGRQMSTGRGSTRVEADQNAAIRLLSTLKRSRGTTCVLIRLARSASDDDTLAKATTIRAAQLKEQGIEQRACGT